MVIEQENWREFLKQQKSISGPRKYVIQNLFWHNMLEYLFGTEAVSALVKIIFG